MSSIDPGIKLSRHLNQYLRKHFSPLKGKKILIAYSGGPDSTALLYLLNNLRVSLGFELRALWVNHGMRDSQEMAGEEDLVVAICQELVVSLKIIVLSDEAKTLFSSLGPEGMARKLRMRALKQEAMDWGAHGIFTAHTLDDQAETILMRLFKGNSYQGLGGIPRNQGLFFRPLLKIKKSLLMEYLKYHQISFSQDTTNSQNIFERNRLRNQLGPLLDRLYPRWKQALGEWGEFQSKIIQEYQRDAKLYFLKDKGPQSVPKPLWDQWNPETKIHWLGLGLSFWGRRRIPRSWFNGALVGLANQGQAPLPGGGVVKVENSFVQFHPTVVNFPNIRYFVSIELNKVINFQGKTLKVSENEEGVPLARSSDGEYFMISKAWGDSLGFTQGRTGLKKLLQTWGVPVNLRSLVPLITDRKNILAVLGSFAGYPDWFRPLADGESAVFLKVR